MNEIKRFWCIEEAFIVQKEINDGEIIVVGDQKYRRAICPWFDGFVKQI